MRILVTGATGFVGRALVAALVERDVEVVASSRNPLRAASQLPLIYRHVKWDPNVGPAPREVFDGVDAIIHLAGENVAGRWTDDKKKRIRDSRVLGTRHLVDSLRGLDDRPRTLVSASAIGYYGDRADDELREDDEPGDDFLARTCVEWETEGVHARALGLDVVQLRISIVLDPAGGALQQMLPPFRFGVGGPLGSGDQWWSWIHRDDLVRMLITSVDERWDGPYNAAAPGVLRQKEFADVLGDVLGRPSFVPAPAFALQMLFGEFSTELLASKRVVPQRALDAGFEFRHPELVDALLDLLD
ncbi:MAG TPA: TIGR01777 family oxidoreductase [Candidatus Krumholzibacteria bacterium]|nr:TIGR01777 family oxidoreductase [Candidatus Krumholzibacteria bacterium]